MQKIDLEKIYNDPEFLALESKHIQLISEANKIIGEINEKFGVPIDYFACPNLNGDGKIVLFNKEYLEDF